MATAARFASRLTVPSHSSECGASLLAASTSSRIRLGLFAFPAPPLSAAETRRGQLLGTLQRGRALLIPVDAGHAEVGAGGGGCGHCRTGSGGFVAGSRRAVENVEPIGMPPRQVPLSQRPTLRSLAPLLLPESFLRSLVPFPATAPSEADRSSRPSPARCRFGELLAAPTIRGGTASLAAEAGGPPATVSRRQPLSAGCTLVSPRSFVTQ